MSTMLPRLAEAIEDVLRGRSAVRRDCAYKARDEVLRK